MNKFDTLYEEVINNYSSQQKIDEIIRFPNVRDDIYMILIKYIVQKYNLQHKADTQFNGSVESKRERLANLIQKILKSKFEYEPKELINIVNTKANLKIPIKVKELEKRIHKLENMKTDKIIDLLNNVSIGGKKVDIKPRAKLKNINVSIK